MAVPTRTTGMGRGTLRFSDGERPRRTWPIETAALAVPIELDTSEADELALDHPDAAERGRAVSRLLGQPQIGGW